MENRISVIFEKIRENRAVYDAWNDSIYRPAGQKEWLEVFRCRAEKVLEVFVENQQLLEELFSHFESGRARPKEYDVLFTWTKDMYLRDYEDPFLLERLLDVLVPHYEAENDVERLMFLYLCCGYANLEISRTEEWDAGKRSVAFYKKMLEYQADFAGFHLPENRIYLMTAYCNLIRVETALGNLPLGEAYGLWKELVALRGEEQYCAFDEEQPRIAVVANLAIDDFRGVAFQYCKEMELTDAKLSGELLELARQYYLKDGTPDESRWDPTSEGFYLCQLVLAYDGTISWDEAWARMDAYYRANLERLSDFADESLNPVGLIANPIARLASSLMHTGKPEKEKQALIHGYCRDIVWLIANYPSGSNSYSMNNALQALACNREILSQLSSAAEKEDYMFRLVISRHISTYLHSLMVACLADDILRAVLRTRPELLVGVMECVCAEDVLQKQEELLAYTRQAALFHDIGKNMMIDIVSTEYRKITDHEFGILKRHPEMGARFLEADAAFAPYHDIVVGHHKSYDGKSGYPDSFDNTVSRWKPLIDLITICDCLDAATDYLSRNYHRAKTFETVLCELEAGAGSRYHPDYVKLIREDETLYQELKKRTEQERETVYYEAYQSFFISQESSSL